MVAIIKADITWSHPKFGNVSLSNGAIYLSEESIKVSGEVSREDSQKFTLAHPAYVDIYADLEKNVAYRNATLDGADVCLDLSGVHVTRYTVSHGAGKPSVSISWYLSALRYTTRNGVKVNCYLLNVPFIHMYRHLNRLEEFPKSVTLVNDGTRYEFSEIDNPNCTFMKTNANDTGVEKLLVHMAFFFNIPVEILMQTKKLSDGYAQVAWNSPRFDTTRETLWHSELTYMNIGSCQNTFADFLTHTTWNGLDERRKQQLKQAVYSFVRSKSCDDTMQFLTIYSILDRYVGNKKGLSYKGKGTYGLMDKRLGEYNIDIRKISPSTDAGIKSLELVLERENKNREVVNFCDLRDYILHFMTTPEIDMFLTSSELLSNMRFATTVIILHEFGFEECNFKQDWRHLSIFLA